MSKRGLALAGVIVAMSMTATSAQASTDSSPEEKTIAGVTVSESINANTSAELREYVASDAPKTVVLDPADASLVRVEAGKNSNRLETQTSVRKNCKTGDACAIGTSPYANYGFYNKGTKTGSWAGRKGVDTHKWSVRIRVSGAWSPWQGKNSFVTVAKVPFTMTGVGIR